MRELNKLEGLHWIRVLYCYPQYFTDDLIDAFAECDKVCKYVDLPLQHISDRILTRMNRPDTREQIEALIKSCVKGSAALQSAQPSSSAFRVKARPTSRN